MSQLTNFGENKLADFFRGQGLASLPASWHLAPLSAYSDASVTEITGAGLTRAAVVRSLAEWAGTQGDGTTLVSTGASHTTSNNNPVSLGTASGSGTLTAVGFFDASSSGNCWMVWQLETPLAFVASDAISLDAATVKFTLGQIGGCTDYLVNKLIDLIFRAQAFSFPATLYHGLFTAAPSNAGGGTEVGGGVGYARATLTADLTSISGTQSAGSTTGSSGTAGRISNNVAITHPTPTGSWGTCGWGAMFDAASSGNMLLWRALASALTIGSGSPTPTYVANAFGITVA